MTVADQTQKVTANGNDSATVFSFSPLVIFATTDLVVTLVDSNGDETLLVEGTSSTTYSVAATTTFPGVGSVTYPASGGTPLATGDSIVMKRVLTIEQDVDLENRGGYFAEVQETALDKGTMVDLQQQEEIDRTLKIPVGFAGTVGELDTPVASRFLRRNAANTAWEHVTISTTTGSASDAAPQNLSFSAAAAGTNEAYARDDHAHFADTIAVANGGTGSTTAAAARTALAVPGTGIVNTFSETQTLDKGADLASATSMALGTDGNHFDVTGTTNIGTITGVAETEFSLQFDDVLVLLDSATLDVRGANITTAAGDTAEFVMATASVAKLTNYWREGVLPHTIATKAAMELANSGDTLAPTSVFHNHPGVAKCWGYVTYSGGTPTLVANYNITSISDDGVGILGVTVATDFSGVNYSVTAHPGHTGDGINTDEDSDLRAAGAFTILIDNTGGAAFDPVTVSFSAHGDQ